MTKSGLINNSGIPDPTVVSSFATQFSESTYDGTTTIITGKLTESRTRILGTADWLEVDYSYNAQGWLTGINSSGLSGAQAALPLCGGVPSPGSPGTSPDANDLFSLALRYDQRYTGTAGTIKKNGNISQAVWQVRGRERMGYNFQYDFLNRLTRANSFDISSSGSPSYTNRFYERMVYADYRGNIGNIYRRGLYKTSSGASCFNNGYTDQLTFQYASGTNRLSSVTEATTGAAAAYGFDPGAGSGSYTYDDNGNLTHNPYKDLDIAYNHLNLPKTMDFPGSDEITVVYDATGNKLSQTTLQGGVSTTRDYLGNLEYIDGTLESIHHSEGRVSFDNGQSLYEYNLTDHLGNLRLSFADRNGDGDVDITSDPATNEVLQEHHYYPFGMALEGDWVNNPVKGNNYRYNGKELNEDFGLGWYDYGARWYDASIGRWKAVDPLAEEAPDWTPYRYSYNNPILFIDPNGTFESPLYDTEGNFLGTDSEGFQGEIIVMSKSVYEKFTDRGQKTLDHDFVTALVENTTVASNLNDAGLTPEAFSNIYTHVVKQMEGEIVDGTKLSFDRLEGGIIHTIDTENSEDGLSQINGERFGNPMNLPINAEAGANVNQDGTINVTTRLLFGTGQMETVEHAQSTLGIHEYYGHGVKGLKGGSSEEHVETYRLQYNHKRTFNKLSPNQRYHIKKRGRIKD